jgi:DNA protecting protein DprA
MNRALFALTHVASQLLYKWLPPPQLSAIDLAFLSRACGPIPIGDAALAALSPADWRSILRWLLLEGGGMLPWFPRYAAAYADADGGVLVRQVHSHFQSMRSAAGLYLPYCDPRYPELLRAISDPPLGLSLRGAPELLAAPCVSVVGSRKASGLAMQVSFATGRALADAGYVVVSGGAYGCDIAAHQGVLASGLEPAPAIAVFAGGLCTLYPRGNAAVFERLAQRRAVFVSERLWEASCRPIDFSARNRIIAGLARATLVMQATHKSGAMITARQALDQGREVSVLSHPSGDVRASGSAQLVSEGARAFASPSEMLGLVAPPARPSQPPVFARFSRDS